MRSRLPLVICLLLQAATAVDRVEASVSCKDENNNDVDWFIMYNVPRIQFEDGTWTKGDEFAYIDSRTLSSDDLWTLSSQSIADVYNPLSYSVAPLFRRTARSRRDLTSEGQTRVRRRERRFLGSLLAAIPRLGVASQAFRAVPAMASRVIVPRPVMIPKIALPRPPVIPKIALPRPPVIPKIALPRPPVIPKIVAPRPPVNPRVPRLISKLTEAVSSGVGVMAEVVNGLANVMRGEIGKTRQGQRNRQRFEDPSETETKLDNDTRREKEEDLVYVAYNDQPPLGYSGAWNGHSKGLVIFDEESGVWIQHSIPRFLDVSAGRYVFPGNALRNGQTVMCITFPTLTSVNSIAS
ncbi:uncharacterized protein LOC135392585 [Ornithodoros turicata]|uniref:uncharacterized protein LOC135392585 n=1 Tax=Ornithodoros turicata TaxID=34597 RepID=UPI0031398F4A